MEKLSREHIHIATATQLAVLLEITPQNLYDSIRLNRVAISLHKIEIAAKKAGMEVGEFIQGLNDWVQTRREQKQLIQEINEFLEKTPNEQVLAA